MESIQDRKKSDHRERSGMGRYHFCKSCLAPANQDIHVEIVLYHLNLTDLKSPDIPSLPRFWQTDRILGFKSLVHLCGVIHKDLGQFLSDLGHSMT